MSRKNILQYPVAEDQSLAASFSSAATIIQNLDNISYQINIDTSDSIGTFALQGSNDYEVDPVTRKVINAGTWVDLELGGGTPSVNAADDQIMIVMQQMPFYAIRLAYTSGTAGTGTCDIYLMAKQVGA